MLDIIVIFFYTACQKKTKYLKGEKNLANRKLISDTDNFNAMPKQLRYLWPILKYRSKER